MSSTPREALLFRNLEALVLESLFSDLRQEVEQVDAGAAAAPARATSATS
jgi:hypothetical protein